MTLPSVLVTDTNIWIDLENGKILADIFRLPFKQTYHHLSVVDLAALLLAKALGANLVTGDRRLNELAKAQGLPVHGVLWILDEMVIHQVLTTTQAARALWKMIDQGARLPNVECQKCFESWL